MGRKARPTIEAQLVREAAALIAHETGLTHADPVARILAQRVREELEAYFDEGDDPLAQAMGDARRKLCATPFAKLATDPDVDTISLFVEGRVRRLCNRSGKYLPMQADKVECRVIMLEVQDRLFRRYLRAMRAADYFPRSAASTKKAA